MGDSVHFEPVGPGLFPVFVLEVAMAASSRFVRSVVAIGGFLSPVVAFAGTGATAAATSAASTFTSSGDGAISAVGGALIGVAVVAVVFKWVKGMIFS